MTLAAAVAAAGSAELADSSGWSIQTAYLDLAHSFEAWVEGEGGKGGRGWLRYQRAPIHIHATFLGAARLHSSVLYRSHRANV